MALSACGSTATETSTDESQEVTQTIASDGGTEESSIVEETTTEAVEMETIYVETKVVYYDGDDAVTRQWEYEYNEYGNEIKSIYTNYDEDGTATVKQYISEYDGSNNLLKSTLYTEDGTALPDCEYEYYDSGKLKSETSYYKGVKDQYCEYDENGNETLIIYYDDNGVDEDKTIYEYDQNGNKIKETITYKDYEEISTYEYDSDNNLIHKVHYEDGNISYDTTYDSYGNETRDISYGEYGSDWSYVNEYDSNGNLIKYTSYKTDNLDEPKYYDIYTYDANNNRILCESYRAGSDSPTQIIEYEYEYDADNNLIRKLTKYDDILYRFEEYAYDLSGNVIKKQRQQYNDDGTVDEDTFELYESTYDSNGNEIEWIAYNVDGTIDLKCEYEYMAIEVPVNN
jgi:hypothetical protein